MCMCMRVYVYVCMCLWCIWADKKGFSFDGPTGCYEYVHRRGNIKGKSLMSQLD